MKKLIVKISEGLGNQLFMYANAFAFSKKKNYDLYIDAKSTYKKLKIRSFLLDKFEISLKYADPEDIPDTFNKYLHHKIDSKIDFFRNKKKFLFEKKDKNKQTKYVDYTLNEYDNKLFIQGYFESEKFFKDYKDDILKKFQIKEIDIKTLFTDPNEILNENSVSIVIRQHRFNKKTIINPYIKI